MSELYELPAGWSYVKLTDIVGKEKTSIKRGPFGSALKKAFFVDSGYKVYEQKNAIKDDFSLGEYYINEEKFNELKGFEVKGGDIIISCSGTIGKISVAPMNIKKGIINQALLKLTLNNDVIDTTFFVNFWIDYVNKGMSEESTKGAAIKNIASVKVLKNLDIPLPPLQEQKRIVAKLDSLFAKIDQAITLHQHNIDEAEALMGSVLNEVFGELVASKKVPLKEITTKIGSGSTPRGGQKAYKSEGISLIRSMNVHDAGFRTKGLAFIDDEQAKKLNNVTIEENDVLLNITGASVARCCILDKNYLPARVNQHVSIIRLKKEVLPKFIHYYLISPSVKSDLLFSSSGGATREAITKSMLENFEVPLPPIETQQKTVQYLDQLSQKTQALKKAQQEKMQSLIDLKASLLDRAFRGKI